MTKGKDKPKLGQCEARVSHPHSWGSNQCTRAAVGVEVGKGIAVLVDKDGKPQPWCKQHLPSEIKKRDEARDQRWKSEIERDTRQRRRIAINTTIAILRAEDRPDLADEVKAALDDVLTMRPAAEDKQA